MAVVRGVPGRSALSGGGSRREPVRVLNVRTVCGVCILGARFAFTEVPLVLLDQEGAHHRPVGETIADTLVLAG